MISPFAIHRMMLQDEAMLHMFQESAMMQLLHEKNVSHALTYRCCGVYDFLNVCIDMIHLSIVNQMRDHVSDAKSGASVSIVRDVCGRIWIRLLSRSVSSMRSFVVIFHATVIVFH